MSDSYAVLQQLNWFPKGHTFPQWLTMQPNPTFHNIDRKKTFQEFDHSCVVFHNASLSRWMAFSSILEMKVLFWRFNRSIENSIFPFTSHFRSCCLLGDGIIPWTWSTVLTLANSLRFFFVTGVGHVPLISVQHMQGSCHYTCTHSQPRETFLPYLLEVYKAACKINILARKPLLID